MSVFERTSVSGSVELIIIIEIIDIGGGQLANIKSAKKRILVNETKAARNKAIKSKVKTYVKKLRQL